MRQATHCVHKRAKQDLFGKLAIAGFLTWIPDKLYLRIRYRQLTGKTLNLDNPKTYNEKLQWLKVYGANPAYTALADKYLVRDFVRKTIGEEYLIPSLGVWDTFDEIDFGRLPKQFVLKTNHDSGGIVICKDKDSFDIDQARQKLDKHLKRNFYWYGREPQYKKIRPRIIAEQYMADDSDCELKDYKFFCFNGAPKFLYISAGLDDHTTAQISFFDLDGNRMPFKRKDYAPLQSEMPIPPHFAEMKAVAAQLAVSVDAPCLRVDLYEIHGRIYFSELTFFPCGGFLPFEPEEWDQILGEWITLPEKRK